MAAKAAVKKKAAKKVATKAVKKVARKVKSANLKTVVTTASPAAFLSSLSDAEQKRDAQVLSELFSAVTKQQPKMWGGSIVGYGDFAYVGKSGRAGDWFLAGFAPRKGTLTLYMLGGWEGNKDLLAKLGKHTLGKGCLYLRRLSDADPKALKVLVVDAFKRAKTIAPTMINGAMS